MSGQVIVFFIEKEIGIREALYEAALSLHGYRVLLVTTVQEAETVKQRLGLKNINVVIADIQGTSDPCAQAWYTLYQCWTAEHPHVPFILMSETADCQELAAIRAGTVCFLEKPFLTDTLLAAVRVILRGKS